MCKVIIINTAKEMFVGKCNAKRDGRGEYYVCYEDGGKFIFIKPALSRKLTFCFISSKTKHEIGLLDKARENAGPDNIVVGKIRINHTAI